MAWFLYLISAIWIAVGSCVILYTAETRNVVKEVLSKTSPKITAFLPLVVGILLVVSASASHQPMIIRLFGALAMIKATFIFLNPENLYHKTTTWYLEELSDQAHRFGGILIVILGTAILSWIK